MEPGKTKYDVIVVGSGPGGATVAREMSLQGQSVLILEWGDHDPVKGTVTQMVPRALVPGKSMLLTGQALGMVRGINKSPRVSSPKMLHRNRLHRTVLIDKPFFYSDLPNRNRRVICSFFGLAPPAERYGCNAQRHIFNAFGEDRRSEFRPDLPVASEIYIACFLRELSHPFRVPGVVGIGRPRVAAAP